MKWEAHSRVVAAIQEWAETQGTVTDPGPSRKTPLVEVCVAYVLRVVWAHIDMRGVLWAR